MSRQSWAGRMALAVLVALVGVLGISATAWSSSTPKTSAGSTALRPHDGPAACSAGNPPVPDQGLCATYAGFNTWYGTYGPGFPVPSGFAWCAGPAAGGGDYPVPSYGYVPSGMPAAPGASQPNANAVGFAFSEAQALTGWDGLAGQFTATQEAAASKLLYDSVFWGQPIGSPDPGTLAAYDWLAGWYDTAAAGSGATGQPVVSLGIPGGRMTVPQTGTFLAIHVAFPGSGTGVGNLPFSFSITGGTFDSSGGPTTISGTTDPDGNFLTTIYPTVGSISITVTSTATVGNIGLFFLVPTSGDLAAQQIVSFPSPSPVTASATFPVIPPALLTGTVSVQKAGNDTAYYGLAGAQFQVFDAATLVDTLTTDATGATPPSVQINAGDTVRIHESVAPSGYQLAPDQFVTVQPLVNTVVTFTGAAQELITPAGLLVRKVDGQTASPLAGATFDVAFDPADTGVYSQDLGSCTTTGPSGTCAPAGNDGPGRFLPGNYRITETAAPAGYWLDPATRVQDVTVTPGETASAATVSFSDLLLGSLQLTKTGNDTAYTSVTGAVFTVTGPSPSVATVGALTVGARGATNVLTGLRPGTYTLTETPPAGYSALPPFQVAVAAGSAVTHTSAADKVRPATVTIEKTDRQTDAPLAGAVFDVRYNPTGSGTFSTDLGDCTTTGSGSCSPAGNDGPDLLPGTYRVTEIQAPPGYLLDPATAVRTVILTPAEVGSVSFSDPLLVPVSFQKSASGNIDPDQLVLAGAVFHVHQGTAAGPVVGSCTSNKAGVCTTAPVLVSGGRYCWVESTSPPGLTAPPGACFTATNSQADSPIAVVEPGDFVAVQARKVAQTSPSTVLAGAVFDLYRMDHGAGPDAPNPGLLTWGGECPCSTRENLSVKGLTVA